jgi:hypothetical protein
MQDFGLKMSDRAACLRDLLAVFRRKHQVEPRTQELHHRLHAASDHATALDLLRQLQEQTPR